ncbi:MAG: 3-dehydroquinate synthase [Thermoleophilaceae bacterium]|jgi:3-dehydroquinate synthase|nr:3-dehydroquinate synthase [Thermoleophilaceae bacterium]
MSTELLSRDLLHTRDAIDLPPPGAPVEGRAARRDRYPIAVTRSLPQTLERLLGLIGDAHVAVITDRTVAELHGEALLGGLADAGVEPEVVAIPAGERFKTLPQALDLLDWLTGTQLARRDVIVTFGGGVVIDMGGWVASCYMRGVPYVNLPTTLVGQVDAGIGGKLAVNHEVAKNLIGGFSQPLGVISDVSFLRTLDRRQLRAGLAEAIKKAIIASPAYWDLIEDSAEPILASDPDALERLVHGASAIKAELIARDPYEEDSRRTLGFGHALAHPLETVTDYSSLLHGEAVAFGMVVEARMSAARGLLSSDTLERIVGLLRRVGLPTSAEELPARVDAKRLLAAIERIRLIRGGGYRFVLPIELGETVIADDVAPEELRAALGACGIDVPR